MKDKIIIAYVCDKHYIDFLKISMESIKNYNKNVEFVILSRDFFTIDDAQVYTFIPEDIRFKFRKNDRMHEGVYYKFWLPILPYDKILYIDCDVICQKPLDDLWNIKCPFICATESHSYGKIQANELGLDKYALSGMMLMNLKELRKQNFTKRCLERLSKENPKFHDETIINLEFNKQIKFIDVKYNYCKNRIYDNPINEEDAYLLHYVGNQKKDMLNNFRRTFIFSNCRTKLKYNIEDLNIKKSDHLIFMNTAWLLTENLDYFKQFNNLEFYVRAVYNRNKFVGYSNPSAGNYLKDVTDKFNNFINKYGINYDFTTLHHHLLNLDTKEDKDIQNYLTNYPSGKSPTTGYMLYKLYEDKNPILVNFFNDDLSKNVFLSNTNKDMYIGHNWKFEKEALDKVKKVFLW